MRQRVLVTGFGPFPGVPVNPSEALAREVAASSPPQVDARFVRLETAWAFVDGEWPRLIAAEDPCAILMFGVAARARRIAIERLARNRRAASPDVTGALPATSVLDPDGPPGREARFPPDRLRAAFCDHGIEARLSRDAGGYLCNAAYWRALETAPEGCRVLFLHIPAGADGALLRRAGERALALISR